MALLEWKPEFSVGNASIDHEHEHMIQAINNLYEQLAEPADAESVEAVLAEIHADISAHFALEERLMREADYVEYEDHKEDHEDLLDQILELRGKPDRQRSDNGPEFISQDLEQWTIKHDIRLEFIQPGNPQLNAYIERYNRTVRYSWLSQCQCQFDSIREVQGYATHWLWFYNNERPNKANGGLPPKHMLAAA